MKTHRRDFWTRLKTKLSSRIFFPLFLAKEQMSKFIVRNIGSVLNIPEILFKIYFDIVNWLWKVLIYSTHFFGFFVASFEIFLVSGNVNDKFTDYKCYKTFLDLKRQWVFSSMGIYCLLPRQIIASYTFKNCSKTHRPAWCIVSLFSRLKVLRSIIETTSIAQITYSNPIASWD